MSKPVRTAPPSPECGPEPVTTVPSQQATNMARAMVMEYGMSDKLGRLRYRQNQEEVFLGHSVARSQNVSEETARIIDAEVKRISEHGKAQGELIRTSMVRQLRSELGLTAVDGAGKIVRDHLADPANQSETVDRVIDELQEMSSGSANAVPSSASLVVSVNSSMLARVPGPADLLEIEATISA